MAVDMQTIEEVFDEPVVEYWDLIYRDPAPWRTFQSSDCTAASTAMLTPSMSTSRRSAIVAGLPSTGDEVAFGAPTAISTRWAQCRIAHALQRVLAAAW